MALQGRSFVLCDVSARGFPIRAASPGFEALFGYAPAECLGKTCGALVGSEAVLQGALGAAAAAGELSTDEAADALQLLSLRAGAQMQAVLTKPGRCGFAVVLNKTKDGQLLACEMHIRILKHAVSGWSYCAGLHSDASARLSASELLRAAAKGREELDALEQRCAEGPASKEVQALLFDQACVSCFHEAAGKMWQDMVSAQVLSGRQGCLKPAKAATPSLASRSTAASSTASGSASGARSKLSIENTSPLLAHLLAVEQEAAAAERARKQHGLQDNEDPAEGDLFQDVHEEEEFEDFYDSDELQLGASAAGDTELEPICRQELLSLEFPFLLADPRQPGCPVIASSKGCECLLEYSAEEVIGSSLSGLWQESANPQFLEEYQKMLAEAQAGRFFKNDGAGLAFLGDGPGAKACLEILPEGELVFTGSIPARSAECAPCMLHLKQVELDDQMYMMCLMVRLFPKLDQGQKGPKGARPRTPEELACSRLSSNMSASIKVLAAQFWYSAPMRRQ